MAFNAVVTKMCNLSSINVVENKADGAASFMVGTTAVSYTHLPGLLIPSNKEMGHNQEENQVSRQSSS